VASGLAAVGRRTVLELAGRITPWARAQHVARSLKNWLQRREEESPDLARGTYSIAPGHRVNCVPLYHQVHQCGGHPEAVGAEQLREGSLQDQLYTVFEAFEDERSPFHFALRVFSRRWAAYPRQQLHVSVALSRRSNVLLPGRAFKRSCGPTPQPTVRSIPSLRSPIPFCRAESPGAPPR